MLLFTRLPVPLTAPDKRCRRGSSPHWAQAPLCSCSLHTCHCSSCSGCTGPFSGHRIPVASCSSSSSSSNWISCAGMHSVGRPRVPAMAVNIRGRSNSNFKRLGHSHMQRLLWHVSCRVAWSLTRQPQLCWHASPCACNGCEHPGPQQQLLPRRPRVFTAIAGTRGRPTLRMPAKLIQLRPPSKRPRHPAGHMPQQPLHMTVSRTFQVNVLQHLLEVQREQQLTRQQDRQSLARTSPQQTMGSTAHAMPVEYDPAWTQVYLQQAHALLLVNQLRSDLNPSSGPITLCLQYSRDRGGTWSTETFLPIKTAQQARMMAACIHTPAAPAVAEPCGCSQLQQAQERQPAWTQAAGNSGNSHAGKRSGLQPQPSPVQPLGPLSSFTHHPKPQTVGDSSTQPLLLRVALVQGQSQRGAPVCRAFSSTIQVDPNHKYFLTGPNMLEPQPIPTVTHKPYTSGSSPRQHKKCRTPRSASPQHTSTASQQPPSTAESNTAWSAQPLLRQACLLVADLALVAGRVREPGDDQLCGDMAQIWSKSQQLQSSLLVYSSTRSWSYFEHVWRWKQRVLHLPDALILAGGTRIMYRVAGGEWQEDIAWRARLDSDSRWDRRRVVEGVQQVTSALNGRAQQQCNRDSHVLRAVSGMQQTGSTGASRTDHTANAVGGNPSAPKVFVRADIRSEQNAHRVRVLVRQSVVRDFLSGLSATFLPTPNARLGIHLHGSAPLQTAPDAHMPRHHVSSWAGISEHHINGEHWTAHVSHNAMSLGQTALLYSSPLPWQVVVHPAGKSSPARSWCAVDIMPQGAGEGAALSHLMARFRIQSHPQRLPVVHAAFANSRAAATLGQVCTHAVLYEPAQTGQTEQARIGARVVHTAEWGAAGVLDGLSKLGLV